MLRFKDSERELRLSVHDVIDAGPQRGSLELKVAWSSSTRMRIGQQIHTQYQQKTENTDQSFRKEVPVKHVMLIKGWEVEIAGRIDGLREEDGVLVVEEIKSSTLPRTLLKEKTLELVSNWARQAELYVYFLQSQGLKARGELIIVSIVDGYQHKLLIPDSDEIEGFLTEQCTWLVEEREKQIQWLQKRFDMAEKGLPFAHAKWREGQEEMSENLRMQLQNERVVLLRAPTGYGKTAASLYAALQVAYKQNRRIFFATARTTQQKMVEKTIDQMIKKGLPIRALSIRSKEKACLNDKMVCRPESCQYANGFYDKLRDSSILDSAWEKKKGLWPRRVKKEAEELVICPYELSLNLGARADVVVGDYNYLFDPAVQLSMISSSLKDWIVIVDEAHNLPNRAQGYGSPRLSLLKLWKAKEQMHLDPKLSKFQAPMEKAFFMVLHGCQKLRAPDDFFLLTEEFSEKIAELASEIELLALDYAVMRLNQPHFSDKDGDPWLDCAWAILKFHSALGRAGEETVGLWEKAGFDRGNNKIQVSQFAAEPPVKSVHTGLGLLCRDPSVFLSSFFDKIGAAVCMSATLFPYDFYQNLLGVSEKRRVILEYNSPFPEENRAAFALPQISTTYQMRSREHPRIAMLLERIIEATPGNIAIFFSSFVVLEDIMSRMTVSEDNTLVQKSRMSPSERNRVLRTMKKAEGHALFAVMGGIFSEGVDLPGEALVTAVMVGPSLPMADLSRRLMQEWYEKTYGEGFRYAWVIPGMARVAQAAGRVIRSAEDRGVVVLIGRRFNEPVFKELFPLEWNLQTTSKLGDELKAFWNYNT